jgi:hypothetical protein
MNVSTHASRTEPPIEPCWLGRAVEVIGPVGPFSRCREGVESIRPQGQWDPVQRVLPQAIEVRSLGLAIHLFNSKKGSLMKRGYRALALLALGALLSAGCGPSTTNEENLGATKTVPGTGETPNIKTYGDYARYQAEKAAKERAAGKGKAAPKAQAGTPKEPPKSE